MSETKRDDRDAVDLTEDENSSCGNSEDEGIRIIDSSGNLNSLLATGSAPDELVHLHTSTPKRDLLISKSDIPKEATTLKNIASPNKLHTIENKKVQQFTSVQIKPPINSIPGTTESVTGPQDIPEGDTLQNIETLSLDSDDSQTANDVTTSKAVQQVQVSKETYNTKLPPTNSMYTQEKPPGKVVIIKKNNKYYKIIIPHNVIPNLTQSVGSVLINIPEVGPLVISNDPQAAKIKPSQSKPQQLSLNLDAVEQNKNVSGVLEQKQKSVVTKKPPVKEIDIRLQMLKDKKYCWKFNSNRKRDLEGFSICDRLGFSKSQAIQARHCEVKLNAIIANLEKSVQVKQRVLEDFRSSLLLKQGKVKLVKINSILEKGRKRIKKRTEKSIQKMEVEKFLPETDDEHEIGNQVEVDNSYDSELLVTKKVVILNNEISENKVAKKPKPKYIGMKRKKKGRPILNVIRRTNLKKSHKKSNVFPRFEIKPCFVHITKDKQVEEAYMKYCQDMGLNVQKKPTITLKSKEKLFYPSVETEKKCDNVNTTNAPTDPTNKPFDSNQTKTIQQTLSTLMPLVIKTRQKLINEINNHKPFLILTDQTIGYNRSLEYYYDQFGKNNILYIVYPNKFKSSVLKANDFVHAVEIGYIKLVDVNLFCKFTMNGMKFSGTKSHTDRQDHNYALHQRYNIEAPNQVSGGPNPDPN